MSERIIGLAVNAEVMQHWCQAAILWRRLGELDSSNFCEEVAQHLAVINRDKLYPYKHKLSGAARRGSCGFQEETQKKETQKYQCA